MNRATLIGRLTKDPEIRTTSSGVNVATTSLATNKKWTDQQGNKQEKTEFHNLVAWKGLADLFSKYCHKGDKLFVEGEIQSRSWDDKNGNKKYITEILVSSVQFMGSPSGNKQERQDNVQDEEEEINISDIPF